MKKIRFYSFLFLPLFLGISGALKHDVAVTPAKNFKTRIETGPSCQKEWYYFKCVDGKWQYSICHDDDGYRVRKRGGNNWSYGNGYKIEEVMKDFGLKWNQCCDSGSSDKNCRCK